MKSNYLKLTAIVLLIGTFVCLGVFAGEKSEKHKDKMVTLPDAVKNAVVSIFPDAKIEKAAIEKEGLKVYEVVVIKDGQEYELTIAPDGAIVGKDAGIKAESLPDAVKAALAGAEVRQVRQEVAYWEVTLTKLDQPKSTYEVEMKKDGKEVTMKFAADGTVLKEEAGDEEKGEHNGKGEENEKDGDEEGQAMTIDQLPAAVKAALMTAAEGGKTGDIEMKDKGEKAYYEADFTTNGQEYEIKIAPDGKVLGKKAEAGNAKDKDEDDNDKGEKSEK